MSKTQLINLNYFEPRNLIFSEPIKVDLPQGMSAYRINLYTKYADNTVGAVVLPTSRLFSYGLQEDMSGKGYTLPMCLWDSKYGTPTSEEQNFMNVFDEICNSCIDHLLRVKFDIDLCDLTKEDLTKEKGGLNPMYFKREIITDETTGKRKLQKVDGMSPTLYVKMMYSKKTDTFVSKIYDVEDNEINPKEMLNKYCFVKAAIKIESIFIGQKPSLQIKIYEAVVEPIEMKTKKERLL